MELVQAIIKADGRSERKCYNFPHPSYRQDLDIVVESPQGQLVAFCVSWFDESSMAGQMEPLGYHKDFRQYQLGRVALQMFAPSPISWGKKRFVETDSYRNTPFRLYESFDFQVIKNVLIYRKDYER